MFPYTPPILSTDSQPIALFLSCLVLPVYLNKGFTKDKDFTWFLLLVLFAIGVFIYSPWDFNSIRSLSNYISLFTISLVTYFFLCKNKGLNPRLFKFAVYVWFGVGTVQTFLYPNFLSFLSPRGSSFIYGRGISCLAPEPTFYAIICCCLLIIMSLQLNGRSKYSLLLWIQIIFYARSATIIFLIIASYLIYILLHNFKLKNIVLACIAGVILIISIKICYPYISSFRAGKLLIAFIDNPMSFISTDASVNERFIHVFFPVYGWLKNWGLPHGFGYFGDFMRDVYNQGNFDEFLLYYRDSYTRIMSGIGSALFELGFIGLIIPFVIIRNIKVISKRKPIFIFYGTLFICILLNAMPLSNAIIGFTIGNIMYSARNYRVTNDEKTISNQCHS